MQIGDRTAGYIKAFKIKKNKYYFWKIFAKKSRGAETTLCHVGFTRKNAG